jgi:SAM-dependent methyltransferase
VKRLIRPVLEAFLPQLKELRLAAESPVQNFGSWDTVRINHRRLEHLATVGFRFDGVSVLEVGAGIGQLSTFFIDRGAHITITEGRPENLAILRERFPSVPVHAVDLEKPPHSFTDKFDFVFCYGTLYHLGNPAAAIRWLAERTRQTLLLETCVSFGNDLSPHIVDEDTAVASQAISGKGCRPTRPWVMAQLQESFPQAYATITQPAHAQFPTDWSTSAAGQFKAPFSRAVFVGSRTELHLPTISTVLPVRQQQA